MSKRYDEPSYDDQFDEYEDVFKIADTRRSNHIQPFIPSDEMNEQKKVIKTYSKDEVARIVFQTKLVDPDECDDELAIRQRECRKHLQNLKVDIEEWESHETRKVIQDEDMEAWLNNLHLKSSPNKKRNSLSEGTTSDGSGRLTPRRPSPSRIVHHHQPVSRPERSTITASPSLPVIQSSDTSSTSHYSRRAAGSSVRPKITFDSSVVDKRSSSRNRSTKVTRKPSSTTTGSTSSYYYAPSTSRKHPSNY